MIKRYVFRRVAFIWTPGEAACRFLALNYGVPPERLLRGLYVVDRKAVAEIPNVSASSCRRFLMVANDMPNRRIDVMVEGFHRWRKGDERLTLCGCGCSRYAGEGVVGVEGVPWPQLPRLYDAADVYVHNGMEQFSTAVQIAAMRGLPIICSGDVGIVSDFNNPDETMVIVCDWQSISAWENAFARLAAMNPGDLQGMCEKVRQKATSLYDADCVTNEVEEHLEFI
jgi:glycosyltransferase involved in cell wall biosynthesis